MANTGAVAGVFLTIGILLAAMALALCFFCRRRRRRLGNPRFMSSISRPLPLPDNPFEDPRTSPQGPQMRYASGFSDHSVLFADMSGRPPLNGLGNVHNTSAERLNGLGLAGIGAGGGRSSYVKRVSTHSKRSSRQSDIVGLAITSDRAQPSSGRSSPSIYPPSIPALSGDNVYTAVDDDMVNVPLRSPSTSTPSLVHPSSPMSIARKPVPQTEDEPTIFAPTPAARPPTAQTKPPVVPPRSPLRRPSTAFSTQSSMHGSGKIRTQYTAEEMRAFAEPLPYEPPTPPMSVSSHDSGSTWPPHVNTNPFMAKPALTNPFAEEMPSPTMTPSPRRDNFYTRTASDRRRPSVEWKSHATPPPSA